VVADQGFLISPNSTILCYVSTIYNKIKKLEDALWIYLSMVLIVTASGLETNTVNM